MSLYRKYRPKTFAEVEGQDHIVRTLQGALLSDRVSHAYLFCGPRGTGKTTIARLFAKAVNCAKLKKEGASTELEPCNTCFSCEEINSGRSLDLIEIDAASNRGIDEIRNLKESAQVATSAASYKIFIVDEVHMLTLPAFNALLKTLEEPPAHVVFILATTEPHKLPETILSRVQRFDFKKLKQEKIKSKLQKIAGLENIKIEDEALVALAVFAGGSLRDAESALTKLIAYAGNEIDTNHAAEILGIVPLRVHENFLRLLFEKKTAEALVCINELYEGGADLENFNKQFVNYVRSCLISSLANQTAVPVAPLTTNFSPNNFVIVLNAFIKAKNEFRNSPVPQLPLELAVMEITRSTDLSQLG